LKARNCNFQGQRPLGPEVGTEHVSPEIASGCAPPAVTIEAGFRDLHDIAVLEFLH
jgi:hypothetical protein